MSLPVDVTAFGFIWGCAEVTRCCSDDKKGWTCIEIKTPRDTVQVYTTKTGKIRFFSEKHGELLKKERN